jgi:hypothetical protein
MKSLFGGFLAAAGVAVGVIAGVEVLLQTPARRPRRSAPQPMPLATDQAPVVAAPAPAELVPSKDSDRNFTIKRTKSEVGYVYWILEGYGKYKCFILCDSWDEAVAQAKAKLAEVDGVAAPLAMAAQA